MQIQQFYFLFLNLVIFLSPFLLKLIFKNSITRTTVVNFLKTYSVVGIGLSIFYSLLVSRSDFQFNSRFTIGSNIANLPIEVYLLFFTVPFALIGIFELVNFKFKEKKILLDKAFFYVFAFTYFFLAFVLSSYSFASTILVLLGLLSIAASYAKTDNIFFSKNFYITLVFALIPFIIFAAIITSLPVITYAKTSILGANLSTIPVEEFFNLFLISSIFLGVYYRFKKAS